MIVDGRKRCLVVMFPISYARIIDRWIDRHPFTSEQTELAGNEKSKLSAPQKALCSAKLEHIRNKLSFATNVSDHASAT
jgi:hypothetical protein